ncbi:MAG: DNA recombination/repair protein RecA, partial [Spirosomaceae bacterium]|nr:DNA recombination/repair protein RecA [Spirosomataceae bacterium]
MADNKEKLKILETTIAKLDKAYGKGTVMRLSDQSVMDVPVISTGSL